MLEEGGRVVQETRLYDPDQDETRSMRSKEEADDYRYFPDPDLIRVNIDPAWLAKIKSTLPELPEAKKQRWMKDFGLGEQDVDVLLADRDLSTVFEKGVKGLSAPLSEKTKILANFLTGEVTRLTRESASAKGLITTEHLVDAVHAVAKGDVSITSAKTILSKLWKSGGNVSEIIEREGLKQVSDVGALDGFISEVIKTSPDQVAEFKSGKEKVLGFLVGQIMKRSGGKANPSVVQDLLKKRLKES